VRTSSNPAFRKLPTGSAAHGPYGAPPVGFNQSQGGHPGYGTPQAPPGEANRPMTVDDVVVKTGLSLGVALVTGVLAAIWAQGQAEAGASGPIIGAIIGGAIVGLILALVIIFRSKPSAPLTLAYSAAEGVALGAVSGVATMLYPGVALQALAGTAGVFIAMLVVYKTGAVKVTPKLTKWIIGAMGGVVALMLINLLLSFVIPGGLGIRSGGPISIIFSLVVIGIAAFSLLLDFDMTDKMIRAGMPQKWAWYAAFGLMTTLVWLYLEILRLLTYFQSD